MSNNYYATVKLSKNHRKVILEKLNRARARNFALLTYLERNAHIKEIGLWLDEVDETIRATDIKLADLYSIVSACEVVDNDGYCWLD